MELCFDGKTILITGGSGGIGAAAAREFAIAGGTVAIHCNRNRASAELLVASLRDDGADAFTVQADLVDPDSAQRLVDVVVSRAGRLDVLVNNAGGLLKRIPIGEADDALGLSLYHLNFGSMFALCRAAIPALKKSGNGAIVNVSSIAARTGGGGGAVLYAAMKGAVSTFTRGLAAELAASGIRVNSVEPGLIETAFHEKVTEPEHFKKMASSIPMGRAGRPEDCAGAVLFLSNSKAAGFVTGQSIGVNGGQLMM
jgi:3-oxoacyl-[acyl-carrier protein] reductase